MPTKQRYLVKLERATAEQLRICWHKNADDVRQRTAENVNHCGRQHRNEQVRPLEWIQQRQNGLRTWRQRTAINSQSASCLINSCALPANPKNMESYFMLICMGAFVYRLRFVWHWQHCTFWKYHSD